MIDDVVRRPHPLMRRDGHHELAAWLQLGRRSKRPPRDRRRYARSRRTRRRGRSVRSGTPASSGSGDVSTAARAAARRASAPPRRARAPSTGRIRRACARLWPVPQPISSSASIGRWLDLAADQRGEDLAACTVPPVRADRAPPSVVDDAFHQRKTHRRLSRKVAKGVTKMAGISGHQVAP